MADDPYAFKPVPAPNGDNTDKLKKLASLQMVPSNDVFRDCFIWGVLVCQFHQPDSPDFDAYYEQVCERYQIALGNVLDSAIENSPKIRLQLPNKTPFQNPGSN